MPSPSTGWRNATSTNTRSRARHPGGDAAFLKRPRQAWGERDAATITRRDAIELLDEIKSTAPVSANRTHSVLVTLLAVEDQLLDATPIAGLKKRAVEGTKDRTLSDDEIARLWRELKTGNGMIDDVALALQVLLVTGQRPGEVAGSQQRELFDLDDPVKAHLGDPCQTHEGAPYAHRPLANGPRIIPARDGQTGQGYSARDFRPATLWRAIRCPAHYRLNSIARTTPPSLANKPPTPHDLRRTVATGLSKLGVPREDRMAVLAHVVGDIHGEVYDKYEGCAKTGRTGDMGRPIAAVRWGAAMSYAERLAPYLSPPSTSSPSLASRTGSCGR